MTSPNLTRRTILFAGSAAGLCLPPVSVTANQHLPHLGLSQLQVSENGRLLVAAGKPFFWLADTAWDILYKLTPNEAIEYFTNRRSLGFNVILAIVMDGNPRRPNREGHVAFRFDGSGGISGPNDSFFSHVDTIVAQANSCGHHMALVPTWGANIGLFDSESAFRYGSYLGRRYEQAGIVWLLGGDINPRPETLDKWRSFGRGLKVGSNGRALVTFHPAIGMSATWFHDEDWLDFNAVQSGHSRIRPEETAIYALISRSHDYHPRKPVIDLESGYERIPNGLNQGRTNESSVVEAERLNAYDIRVRAYQTVFAGAFGYTYGALDVITFFKDGDRARWPPNLPWRDALNLPGARQVGHLKALMEALPVDRRAPAQEIIKSAVRWKYERVQATADRSGQWFLVYSTAGRPFSVDMSSISGPHAAASWIDPRTGKESQIGLYPSRGVVEFAPPSESSDIPRGGVIKLAVEPGNDWVLKVIASRKTAR